MGRGGGGGIPVILGSGGGGRMPVIPGRGGGGGIVATSCNVATDAGICIPGRGDGCCGNMSDVPGRGGGKGQGGTGAAENRFHSGEAELTEKQEDATLDTSCGSTLSGVLEEQVLGGELWVTFGHCPKSSLV